MSFCAFGPGQTGANQEGTNTALPRQGLGSGRTPRKVTWPSPFRPGARWPKSKNTMQKYSSTKVQGLDRPPSHSRPACQLLVGSSPRVQAGPVRVAPNNLKFAKNR